MGPITLTLPVSTAQPAAPGLHLGATAAYTAAEATLATLPGSETALLVWAAALNHLGVLAFIFEGHISPVPITAGVVMILIAAVFQFGGRLQKDTEGLV